MITTKENTRFMKCVFVHIIAFGLFAVACLPSMSPDAHQAMRCDQGITMLDRDKCNPTSEQQRKGMRAVPAAQTPHVYESISLVRG